MRLILNNICKIKKAVVELNGITVIAGSNNTGKSTVGKALYCFFNGLYEVNSKIKQERKDSIEKLLGRNMSFMFELKNRDIANIIVNVQEKYLEDEKELFNLIRSIIKDYFILENVYDSELTESDIVSISQEILNILKISNDNIIMRMLSNIFVSEFDEQINNIYNDISSELELMIKDRSIKIVIDNNKVTKFDNSGRVGLNTEVVYIDDPFILDNVYSFTNMFGSTTNALYQVHREHLKSKIVSLNKNNSIQSILVDEGLERIMKKLNMICEGDIEQNSIGQLVYVENGKSLNIKNISTGLKTFVILKKLLENGIIQKNGTIILDEPEIHLHPEWQLVFAEIIVLLQKEFELHILLNTHSPYFLRAIEIYSAKYEIADKCKYYLADIVDEVSIIEDVTTYTEKIYQKLTKPLEELQREIYSND